MIVPQNFRAQPYAYLTNQVGHIGLGMFVAVLVCFAHLFAFEEYPYRAAIWFMVFIIYLGWAELTVQGWRGGDTIEDTVFVCGYGAGGLLWTMQEINPGTGDFTGNIWDAMPFLGLATFHLAVGCGIRVWQKRNRVSLD